MTYPPPPVLKSCRKRRRARGNQPRWSLKRTPRCLPQHLFLLACRQDQPFHRQPNRYLQRLGVQLRPTIVLESGLFWPSSLWSGSLWRRRPSPVRTVRRLQAIRAVFVIRAGLSEIDSSVLKPMEKSAGRRRLLGNNRRRNVGATKRKRDVRLIRMWFWAYRGSPVKMR